MTAPAASAPAAASAASPAAASAGITMFGAEWCRDCRRSKKLLDELGVAYDYVDLESVADGADRAKAISGRTQIPVIVFADDSHLVEPSDAAVRAKLAELGTI